MVDKKKTVQKKAPKATVARKTKASAKKTSSRSRPNSKRKTPTQKDKSDSQRQQQQIDLEAFVQHLKAERVQLAERLAHIDALLETYGESPGKNEGLSQRVESARNSAMQWFKGVVEEGGHKWEELVKKFEESNPGQKLTNLEATLRSKYFKRSEENNSTENNEAP